MKYLRISNKGIINVEALTLLGASTKRGLNGKIGMFGSGNKYALAFLLRNGFEVSIYAGNEKIEIGTEKAQFRDNDFEVITINSTKTSITTEFGKDWKLWQAIRELYCNAIDEGHPSLEYVSDIGPVEDETHFYIRNRKEIASFVGDFDKYFSENRKVLFECKHGKILEKATEGFNLFRRGIKCFNSNKNSVYDYDLVNIDIDENRLVKYGWEVPSKIWNVIYQCTDKEIIKNILFNCSDSEYIECISSDFAVLNSELMSDEYIEILNEIKIAPKGLSGLLNIDEVGNTTVLPSLVFNQAKTKVSNDNLASKFKIYQNELYREIPMNELQISTLNKAKDFFKECNYDEPISYPISYAVFENKEVLGLANLEEKKIILSELCVSKGTQSVIETIIEEYVHLQYEVGDETRRFQDAVISEFVVMLKKKNAYLV
ncbi:hypothetical protein FORMB_17210 [Formosa sp. Hel1_33_131]|uniref:hypothetical protein n=1 Tax=Formosa sp. Hel1_33_131 TaxID=1336794 RepID=UPI00084E297D|nr:hypothetical protein [Formosa sp. Hel1_33_131]AOR28760.1 hypothetical protein FORMB_17210 [Formosa sp. Hel1_33_131]